MLMKEAFQKFSKKQIIITVILLLGIIFSVILVQRQQIFKSKAEVDVTEGLKIEGARGEEITCSEGLCETEADEVTIEVIDPNIFLKD